MTWQRSADHLGVEGITQVGTSQSRPENDRLVNHSLQHRPMAKATARLAWHQSQVCPDASFGTALLNDDASRSRLVMRK
jgi:hypothetical protein